MAFTIPQFPLLVGIYTGPWLSKSHRGNVNANLAPGRRNLTPNSGWEGGSQIVPIDSVLLLPSGTDIRDGYCAGMVPDVVEVPVGSGRWYAVIGVDDYGKGFPNEHRYALINKIGQWVDGTLYAGLFWPTPIP